MPEENLEKSQKAAGLAREILKLAQSTLMIKLRFLDMALSRLTLTEGEGLTGTDGRELRFDPWQVLELYKANKYDAVRLTLHSLVHCIAAHPFTDPRVDRRLWDLAADMAAENVVLELDPSAEEAPEKNRELYELRRRMPKNGLVTAGRLYARLREEQPAEARLQELEKLFKRDDHGLWYRWAGELLPEEEGEEPEEEASAAPAPARRPPDRDRPDGADTDSDGLPDSVELEKWNTDPDNPDTDADGLRDGDEATKYHTDPLNPDTDADGLRDGDEVNEYRTDPNNPDTDGDGVWDGAEILKHKTDPLNPATNAPALHADSADGAKEPAP